ncbi:MmgE/PrpD family protein [Natrialbaceae archaeon A-CW2]|uniref:MmgE/PrpD family protein n=1 Tax=Natronosalvus amylolyticus TaxID=2961994 RepID=UPI0020C942D4|nr:MmgE/PrpD family protein [Natronosalvus amylolyticus]
MTLANDIASFTTQLTYDELPADVRDRVGLVVADTFGAIVGGASTEPVHSLSDRYHRTEAGPVPVLGTDVQLPVNRGALCNGIAGVVLELDEGHKMAAGHPSIHVLPAVLAVAERDDLSGEAFVTAFVAGYETAVRIARGCTPLADGYHPHGVWGVVGAAAAVAHATNLDRSQTTNALRMAANHAQHTRFEAALEGATVRDTYAAMNAPAALFAVEQAAAGFTGLEDGISRHLEGITAEGVDPAPVETLGDRWEITNGYFKVHAACRYTHPTLDALEDLLESESIQPDTVSSVTVETYPAAATLTETNPTTRLEAKFSIPFAVATRLINGGSGKDAFEPHAISGRTRELAQRVSVTSTQRFIDALPDSRGARVAVALEDGTEHTRTVTQARGGSERPITEAQLREKFRSLTEPTLGEEKALEAWEVLREPTTVPVSSLTRACRPDT